jgi:hypothetical protein
MEKLFYFLVYLFNFFLMLNFIHITFLFIFWFKLTWRVKNFFELSENLFSERTQHPGLKRMMWVQLDLYECKSSYEMEYLLVCECGTHELAWWYKPLKVYAMKARIALAHLGNSIPSIKDKSYWHNEYWTCARMDFEYSKMPRRSNIALKFELYIIIIWNVESIIIKYFQGWTLKF